MKEINFNILYVDDEQANLNSLKSLFRRKYNIITADSGKKGLEILDAQPIHLIIADQRMPSMTGIQFLKKVKEKWPELKCILLTGFYDNVVIKEAINDVGIYWYMNKPFNNEKLEHVIRKAIEAFNLNTLVKKSEEKFRGVFNSMTDVFTRSDMEGKGLILSPSVFDVTGYKAEELIGRKFTDIFVNPAYRDFIKQELQESKGVRNFEFDIYKKDGSIITLSSNAKIYYDDKGNPLGIESVFRDITRQKKADETLRVSEEKFKGIFNSIIDVFIRRDLEHKGVLASPSLFEVTGYEVEDIIGHDITKCFVDPQKPEWIKQYLLENRGVHTIEFELYKKDRTIISISSNARVYHANDGKPIGIESVLRDVTKQKQTELQILEYQKHLKDLATEITLTEEKVRKQIAIDLHDDVGQLLTSSRMQLSTINDEMDKLEISKKIDNISKALLQASQATRDAIFNLSPPQLHEIGLSAAVHDWMKEQVEVKYGIKTTISGKKEKYKLDENTRFLVFRSIRELMINVTKHARAAHLNIELNRKKDMLEIIVRDDGIGFNYNANLFKLKSKSYGLFSIQERMSDLGGSMKITSAPGFGAKIKLTIPLRE